jgi:hypothetical protein
MASGIMSQLGDEEPSSESSDSLGNDSNKKRKRRKRYRRLDSHSRDGRFYPSSKDPGDTEEDEWWFDVPEAEVMEETVDNTSILSMSGNKRVRGNPKNDHDYD